MDQAKAVVVKVFDDCSRKMITERTAVKGKLKRELRDILYDKTKRTPMLLPVIIEI